MPISILMSKIFFLWNIYQLLGPKLKLLRIYWNLTHLIFQICQSWFWCQKWFLLNIYPLLGSNWNLAHLIFQISWSQFWCQKLFFIKYLPITRPQLIPKWKMLRIYWNLIKIEIWLKYLIKIIFDIKIEIGFFKILNVPYFNKSWAFLIFRLIWG